MSTTATSTHTSPASDHHIMNMPYQLSRDQFSIEMPSPGLHAANGNGSLKTPNSLASPSDRRAQSFSRDGILGSAQKARNLSQSSADRNGIANGNHIGTSNGSNSNGKDSGDDGINPLKRRNTDAGNDYPRRRATIAVRLAHLSPPSVSLYLSPPPCPYTDKTPVRNLPLPQIPLRRQQAQMPSLRRARRRLHLPRAGHKARCGRQADSRAAEPY